MKKPPTDSVHLGFEIGSGHPISVPVLVRNDQCLRRVYMICCPDNSVVHADVLAAMAGRDWTSARQVHALLGCWALGSVREQLHYLASHLYRQHHKP